MASLIIYIGITAFGYLVGTRLRAPADRGPEYGGRDPFAWIGTLQTVVIAVLVFIMGCRIGASKEIVASLGTIGLKAFAYTMIILITAVAGFALTRRLLGFDRQGRRRKETAENDGDSNREYGGKRGIDPMMILIIGFVALGILTGYLILPESFIARTGTLLTWMLYVLLFLIGTNIARDGTLGENFRSAGWRIFVFPFVSILTMMAGSVIAAWCLSMTTKDALCVGAGFGWYTLAPAMLAPYSAEVSALSFLHNVMRELLGVLLVPVVAKRIGYIECYAVPGSSTMDVCLPIISHSAGSTIAVYGFITGTVLAIAVPILENLFMGL